MPKKNNDLEEYLFVALPEWTGLAEFRETEAEVAKVYEKYGYSHPKIEKAKDNCRDRFDFDELIENGSIVTAKRFFEQFKPINLPFTILARGEDSGPLPATVRDIDDPAELQAINAAVNGREPFNLELGYGYFCGPSSGWLLGNCFWEFTKSEYGRPEDELKLLLLEAADKDRLKFERLRRKFQGVPDSEPRREQISEGVRIFVWRRDDGKCVECGSRERLEFDHIIPVSKGGSNTERNIQLLCETCNRSKSDHI